MKYFKNFFPILCLSISLLLLSYIFYKSEISWQGSRRNFYIIYYIFSFLLIFFSIIIFYLSKKINEYLIILSVSLILSLYFFEGYSLIKDIYNPSINIKKKIYEKQTGKKYDTRSKLQVYKELKKIDSNVTLKVSPKNYLQNNHILFPLSSISNSKTIYNNENGYYFIYESDRYGFNNPDKEWDSNELKYMLIGDSFTHGANVNRPNDMASVLRTLSDKSTLNLGYSGNGPLIQYATLREYLNPNVKKIIWIYFEGNDLIDLNDEINNKTLISYLNDLTFSQNLKVRQNEINSLVNDVLNKTNLNKYTRFIKLYKTRQMMSNLLKVKSLTKKSVKNNTKNNPLLPLTQFKRIIKQAKNLSKKNNSQFYFVYLPKYQRYKNGYEDPNYNLVKKIIRELDIPFIDIHSEVFQKEKNPLKLFPFEMKGHYNVEGYKKIAEIIYKYTQG